MINILIIDDAKSYNDTFSTIINKPDYNIYQAYNLNEAKNILEEETVHYIISDISFEDGKINELISNESTNNDPKIIILSSNKDIHKRSNLFEEGIIDFCSKETAVKKLIEEIHNKIELLESNKNKNILIIDDSTLIREKLTQLLSNHKYNLFAARDGIEGLDILDKEKIDLIYLDIEMPRMNGIEFLEQLDIHHSEKRIPTLILSNNKGTDDYSKALRYGAVDFINKPFLAEELILKTHLFISRFDYIKKIASQAKELKEYKRVLNESDIVSITDSKGVIKEVNDKFCETSGYAREKLLGKTHKIVNHPEMPKKVFQELWTNVKAHETFKGIIKNKRKDGSAYYVDATISPIMGIDGEIKEIIGIRHDVTDIMNPKKQLIADLAFVEKPILIFLQLTNYDLLKEFYSETVMHTFEFEFEQVVLNYFPSYIKITKVYNLGNGLFAFLKKQELEIAQIENYLQEVLEKFQKIGISFKENNYDIDISLSFANEGENILDDVYVGIQKAIKTKTPIIYANGLHKQRQEKAREKLKSIQKIKDALSGNGEFISYFQPIYDNRTGEIEKYESLVRLIDKDGEVLTPYYFLDIAKKTGYYLDITKIVIENSFKALEHTDKDITINLSSSDIESAEIREKLLELTTKEENIGRITFELLEDEEIKNFELVKNFILEIKEKGKVKIAIDDFGSGYSNYERLLAFQPDILKIDGSLIKDITEDISKKNVVESLIVFAQKQNIKTIAEFVSNEDILRLITQLGIDYSQGFYLGEPKRLF